LTPVCADSISIPNFKVLTIVPRFDAGVPARP
jgi:hypothetical protein